MASRCQELLAYGVPLRRGDRKGRHGDRKGLLGITRHPHLLLCSASWLGDEILSLIPVVSQLCDVQVPTQVCCSYYSSVGTREPPSLGLVTGWWVQDACKVGTSVYWDLVLLGPAWSPALQLCGIFKFFYFTFFVYIMYE